MVVSWNTAMWCAGSLGEMIFFILRPVKLLFYTVVCDCAKRYFFPRRWQFWTRLRPSTGLWRFLSDIRRMNVGMTRARRKLLLVGDSSTLCSHPFFVDLLAYVKGVGG
jgi:hypothetical protein